MSKQTTRSSTRSSTPNYLTPRSSDIWHASMKNLDKNEDFESKLASKIASKLASRIQSQSATPRNYSQSATPRMRKSLSIIPECSESRRSISPLQTPPRGGVPKPTTTQNYAVQEPITPPREWRSPKHVDRAHQRGFVIPYHRQTEPVIRMAYTDGTHSTFMEAPAKQGTVFNFGSQNSQFQYKY